MDGKLGVQHGHHSHNGISKPPVHHHHHHHAGGKRAAGSAGRQSGGGGGKAAGIKVVYISSPMKLTASAEEFRAIVQELTGRDSNVADHDLVAGAGAGYYAGGAPSSSYSSSFGHVSRPTASAHALSPTANAAANSGPPVRRAPEYAATPPPFQGSMSFDQTAAGSLLYGQDYW